MKPKIGISRQSNQNAGTGGHVAGSAYPRPVVKVDIGAGKATSKYTLKHLLLVIRGSKSSF